MGVCGTKSLVKGFKLQASRSIPLMLLVSSLLGFRVQGAGVGVGVESLLSGLECWAVGDVVVFRA